MITDDDIYTGIMLYYGHYSLEDAQNQNNNVDIMGYGNTIHQCLYNSLTSMHEKFPYHFNESDNFNEDLQKCHNGIKNKKNVIGPLYIQKGLYSIDRFYKKMEKIISDNDHDRIESQMFLLQHNHKYIKAVLHIPNLSNDVSLIIIKIPKNTKHIILTLNYASCYADNLLDNDDNLMLDIINEINNLPDKLINETISMFNKKNNNNDNLNFGTFDKNNIVTNNEKYRYKCDISTIYNKNKYNGENHIIDVCPLFHNTKISGLYINNIYNGNPLFGSYIINIC
jgi:hypothetical protein